VNTDRFRALLLEERGRVAGASDHLDEDAARSPGDATEEELFDQHPADAATATLDREIATTLGENSEHVLKAIDDALSRLDAGTYGTCVRCGGPIAEERLEAMPQADKCIECKRIEGR
jgi:RNA polymerase-binding protein DksA